MRFFRLPVYAVGRNVFRAYSLSRSNAVHFTEADVFSSATNIGRASRVRELCLFLRTVNRVRKEEADSE